MLPISLREEQIARQMSSRIYSRALELYRKGAIANLVLRGKRLTAQVEGFHAPFYTVVIDFDEQGVQRASCTCAYEYGDWCKHIGAVLLTCIRAPEKIVQQPPIEEVLEPLDTAALRRVLLELATDPEVADRITLLAQIAQQPPREASDAPRALRVTDFARDVVDGSIETLGAVGKTIQQLIEKADYASALKLISAESERVLDLNWRWRIGDAHEFYDFYTDSNPAEDALNALADLATELVLSLPDPKDPLMQQIAQLVRGWLQQELDPWSDEIRTCIYVLVQHGRIPPKFFRREYDSEFDEWLEALSDIERARDLWHSDFEEDFVDLANIIQLRVLEQRGAIEAYLKLAWESGQYHRYAIMRALQGEVEMAIETARQQFRKLYEWDSFVRALDALGHTETAIPLAYDALRESHKRRRSDPYDPEADLRASLGEWLAARAADAGETAIALEAMQISVEDEPTLEKYKRLEQLAGAQWAKLRPKVLRRIREHRDAEEVAAIYIYEGKHADALQILCDRHALTPALARQVADHAPAATRAACLEEANKIILNTRSRDYPLAADWLEVVKRSYHAEGKPHEWEAFIQTLMEQHKRKTALIPLLQQLAKEG